MRAIKVNADYEKMLFYGKLSPEMLNYSLEFLALYLDERPLASAKKYDQKYLAHVERVSRHRPVILDTKDYENWWGKLENPELEKKLNSKLTSAELNLSEGWCPDTQIINSLNEISSLKKDKTYLAKNPFGMSGQNILSFTVNEKNKIEQLFKSGSSVIIEPYLNRKFDFSHYVFTDGKCICYENLVDKKFQYRGTRFQDHTHPTINNLSFYQSIPLVEWQVFNQRLETIISHYRQLGAKDGFSIDSFVYEEEGKLKIRALCEINYRRTMGEVSYMLSQKYAKTYPWTLFLLGKKINDFSFHGHRNTLLLSPGDTRFEIFFLYAESEFAGKKVLNELGSLLPGCQFPVEL